MKRVRRTATEGACKRSVFLDLNILYTDFDVSGYRFQQAFENWGGSLVQQSKNRNKGRMPSVNEFILMRRNTIGAQLVEGTGITPIY